MAPQAKQSVVQRAMEKTAVAPKKALEIVLKPVDKQAVASRSIAKQAFMLKPVEKVARTFTQTSAFSVQRAARPAALAATKKFAPSFSATRVRGDLPFVLGSPLSGVSDEDWTCFALLVRSAPVRAVSAANAIGMFEITPRRLADLGLMTNLESARAPSGRTVYVGEFVKPWSLGRFLSNPKAQYAAFTQSMKDYFARLPAVMPAGLSRSGALAVLHRVGPQGLETWCERRFPNTEAFVEKVNGIF